MWKQRETTETHANKMKTVWSPSAVDGDDDEWGNEKNAKVEQLGKRTRKVLGSFTVHLLFLLLKFELVFLLHCRLLLLFLTSCYRVRRGRKWGGERERERKTEKIYFSWLWKSNSQLDFNFVCVCLSVPFWAIVIAVSGAVSFGSVGCQLWLAVNGDSCSDLRLYVNGLSYSRPKIKCHAKWISNIFLFDFFWMIFPTLFNRSMRYNCRQGQRVAESKSERRGEGGRR